MESAGLESSENVYTTAKEDLRLANLIFSKRWASINSLPQTCL